MGSLSRRLGPFVAISFLRPIIFRNNNCLSYCQHLYVRRAASTQVKTQLLQQQQGQGSSSSTSTSTTTPSSPAEVPGSSGLENATVSLSDPCVAQLKKVTSNAKPYLRVYVEGGGCSGFQYKFELESEVKPDDRVFERDGGKLIVDETSLEYLKGSTIDYQHELIRSAFRVSSNPKAEHGCSCGASFSVKID